MGNSFVKQFMDLGLSQEEAIKMVGFKFSYVKKNLQLFLKENEIRGRTKLLNNEDFFTTLKDLKKLRYGRKMLADRLSNVVEHRFENYYNEIYFISDHNRFSNINISRKKRVIKNNHHDFLKQTGILYLKFGVKTALKTESYYVQNGQYRKKLTNVHITVPEPKFQDIKILTADGFPGLEILNRHTIDDYDCFKISYIKRTSSKYNLSVDECFLVKKTIDNIDFFYHADALKKAIAGVEKKIKTYRTPSKLDNLSLDTMITMTDYHNLTGACFPGMKSFLSSHDITKRRMKVSEVLELVEKNKAWGYKRLKELVTEGEVNV